LSDHDGSCWAATHVACEQPHALTRRPRPPLFQFPPGLYLGDGRPVTFSLALNPQWTAQPWTLLGRSRLHDDGEQTAAALKRRDARASRGGVISRRPCRVSSFSQASPSAWLSRRWRGRAVRCVRRRIFDPVDERGGNSHPFAGSVGAKCRWLFAPRRASPCVARGDDPRYSSIDRAHVINLSLILALVWQRQGSKFARKAVLPAWLAADTWKRDHPAAAPDWKEAMALAARLRRLQRGSVRG